ncbi:glycosyltransferase family 4 protein [Arenibaculum pallidiluteum]|uniref:glycosyltransferase family 4 protein n=1 Tax=Arenibaculum pallidiluteum TaxID=2812559 RepID=UPI001A95F915|nr:glycosyltransferase family 4 protein [Arenibaculum pallidiluteum]
MRILLINHYAGSDSLGMEYRPFYLAREWKALGYATTILGADFSHLRHHQPDIHADLEATEEEGVRFRWIRTPPYAGNGMARVANMLGFAGKLLFHAGRIAREEKPDIVVCSSTYPLDIHGGARIARNCGARLVFEVHDLWPLTPMLLGGYGRAHPYVMLLQHAEDYAYRHADTVVSIIPNTRDYMIGRGLEPRKFAHVPNGIVTSHAPAGGLSSGVADSIERERTRGRFLVGYAGGLNTADAVEYLVEAALRLSGSGVSLLIVGDGPKARQLREQAAGADSIHLLGRIPKTAVPDFLSRMDVLALSWHRSPLYRFGMSPNKVFDYMHAGKPIVQACEAGNDLPAAAECGVTVPPEDAAALACEILRMRDLPQPERQRLGENGRRFVLQNHDYRVLARRFLDVVAASRVPEAAGTGSLAPTAGG